MIKKPFQRFLYRSSKFFNSPIALAMPLFAWIEPTQKCNLHCRTCYKTVLGNSNQDMDPEVYQKVLQELVPYLLGAQLCGNGEPFLFKEFESMLEYFTNRDIEIAFTSNLTIIKPQQMDSLVQKKLRLEVSVDGADTVTFEYVRRGAKYEVVMKNLKILSKLAQEKGHPAFQLSLNIVLLRCNIPQINDILNQASQLGIKRVVCFNQGIEDRSDDFVEEALSHYPELVREYIPKISTHAQELSIDLSLPNFNWALKNKLLHPKPIQNKKPVQECYMPWRATFIDVEGRVMPCCAAYHVLGNIKEKSFRAIWNDKPYRELRGRVNSTKPPKFCMHCNLYFSITGGDKYYYYYD